MLKIRLVLVAVELFAEEHEPVLLQHTTLLLFLQDLTLLMNRIFSFTTIAIFFTCFSGETTNAETDLGVLVELTILEDIPQSKSILFIDVAWRAWTI